MNTLLIEIQEAKARHVTVTADTLAVDLADGRSISVPIGWFPRLAYGTPEERNHWRLIGKGNGIHWPDLDEDISIDYLLAGKPSGESQRSLKQWFEKRAEHGRIFKLTLQKAYYEGGFFNVPAEFDKYVNPGEGDVTLVLEDEKPIRVPGRIDRRSNKNRTARIRGGSKLRDWFQKQFSLMDTLDVDLRSVEMIHLRRNQ